MIRTNAFSECSYFFLKPLLGSSGVIAWSCLPMACCKAADLVAVGILSERSVQRHQLVQQYGRRIQEKMI